MYFKTSGWIERGEGLSQYPQDAIQNQTGMAQTYEQLVAKYGEDNAKFLYEELCNMTRNYSGMTFIAMGIEPDDRFERQARQQAAAKNWKFERIEGDMSLLQQLLDGPWDDERFSGRAPGRPRGGELRRASHQTGVTLYHFLRDGYSHPERTEGSPPRSAQILRFAQNDELRGATAV